MAAEYYVYVGKKNAETGNTEQLNSATNGGNNLNSGVNTEAVANAVSGGSTASVVATAIKNVIISETTKYAQYALSNVGKYTGDSHAQTAVNNGLQSMSLIAQAYASPVVAALNMTFNTVKTVNNHNFDISLESSKLKEEQARNGYSDSKSVAISRRHY